MDYGGNKIPENANSFFFFFLSPGITVIRGFCKLNRVVEIWAEERKYYSGKAEKKSGADKAMYRVRREWSMEIRQMIDITK